MRLNFLYDLKTYFNDQLKQHNFVIQGLVPLSNLFLKTGYRQYYLATWNKCFSLVFINNKIFASDYFLRKYHHPLHSGSLKSQFDILGSDIIGNFQSFSFQVGIRVNSNPGGLAPKKWILQMNSRCQNIIRSVNSPCVYRRRRWRHHFLCSWKKNKNGI